MSDPFSLSPRDAGAAVTPALAFGTAPPGHPPPGPRSTGPHPAAPDLPGTGNDDRAEQDRLPGDDPAPGSTGRSLLRRPMALARRLFGLATADGDRRNALLEELIEESQRFIGNQAHSLEHKILANIVDLRDRTAYDVMVPRIDIAAVPCDTSFDALIAIIHEKTHSRLPVYGENLDVVLGMVHIKDVIASMVSGERFDLRSILRDVLFVAPSMRVTDLLVKMQMSRIHMAMVVDEFGGIDGLVTIEDLVETIVGEIEDEHDAVDETAMAFEADGTLVADARVPIDLFEARVGSVLSDSERAEDIDTLGGLVFHIAGRVPSRGELIGHGSGIAFEVVEADPRRIQTLRVRGLGHLRQGCGTPVGASPAMPAPVGDPASPPDPPAGGSPREPEAGGDDDPAPGDRRTWRREGGDRPEHAAIAKAAAAKAAAVRAALEQREARRNGAAALPRDAGPVGRPEADGAASDGTASDGRASDDTVSEDTVSEGVVTGRPMPKMMAEDGTSMTHHADVRPSRRSRGPAAPRSGAD